MKLLKEIFEIICCIFVFLFIFVVCNPVAWIGILVVTLLLKECR